MPCGGRPTASSSCELLPRQPQHMPLTAVSFLTPLPLLPALQMGRVGSMLRSWSLDVCPQRLIQVGQEVEGCASGGWD